MYVFQEEILDLLKEGCDLLPSQLASEVSEHLYFIKLGERDVYNR